MTALAEDRGGAAVELVLVTPLLVLFLLFVVFAGRLTIATGDVNNAARRSARAASLARDVAAAATEADAAARAALEAAGVPCDDVDVETDTTRFAPGGTVAVVVRCTMPLGDLGLLGLDSNRSVTARQVAIIDRFRGVG